MQDIKDTIIYVENNTPKNILKRFKKTANHYKNSNYDYKYVENKVYKNYGVMFADYILHLYYT